MENFQKKRGFTLVELLISLAIIVMMTTISFIGLAGYRGRQTISLSVNEVVAVLQDTRNRSVTQEEGKAWGVRFQNADQDEYLVFKGYNFSQSSVSRSYIFRRGVSFSEPAEGFFKDIVFEPISGQTEITKIISLIGEGKEVKNNVGDIIISRTGLISGRVEDGLVGYWHFDEGTSTVTYDATSHKNNGLIYGGANWVKGKVGGALDFNGINNYVALPPNFLNVVDFTFIAWVKWNGGGNWQRIFDFGQNTNANMFLTPKSGANTLRFAITISGSNNEQRLNTDYLPVGEWKFIAVVLDGDIGRLYVDGVLKDTQTITLNPNQVVGANNWFGKSQYTADEYFNGLIDEIRIYNRALSEEEIKTIYELTK